MKTFYALLLLVLFSVSLAGQEQAKVEINQVLDAWHQAAAVSDQEAYFEKIDDEGIYIGTDSAEMWTRQEFYEWSTPYFEQEKGWAFSTLERNVYISEDGSMAWFDEQLKYGKNILRGSGVLVKRREDWRILHYVLSVAVPNDKYKEVMKVIQEKPMVTDEE